MPQKDEKELGPLLTKWLLIYPLAVVFLALILMLLIEP